MLKSEVVDFFGSARNAAKALGITPAAVSQWGDIVPELRAYQLQQVTKGKLKAGLLEKKQK